jgi:hypothetical protein
MFGGQTSSEGEQVIEKTEICTWYYSAVMKMHYMHRFRQMALRFFHPNSEASDDFGGVVSSGVKVLEFNCYEKSFLWGSE